MPEYKEEEIYLNTKNNFISFHAHQHVTNTNTIHIYFSPFKFRNCFTLLHQEGFSFLQSLFHLSSLEGKILPFLRHVFPSFSELCNCCLDFLKVKESMLFKFTAMNRKNTGG